MKELMFCQEAADCLGDADWWWVSLLKATNVEQNEEKHIQPFYMCFYFVTQIHTYEGSYCEEKTVFIKVNSESWDRCVRLFEMISS